MVIFCPNCLEFICTTRMNTIFSKILSDWYIQVSIGQNEIQMRPKYSQIVKMGSKLVQIGNTSLNLSQQVQIGPNYSKSDCHDQSKCVPIGLNKFQLIQMGVGPNRPTSSKWVLVGVSRQKLLKIRYGSDCDRSRLVLFGQKQSLLVQVGTYLLKWG